MTRVPWIGTGRPWTAPACAPKGGCGGWPQPDRPWQAGRSWPRFQRRSRWNASGGTKRHLVTDARGTPLGVTLSGTNRNNSMMLAATLDAVPGVRARHRGRSRRRPGKLHADKGYDHRRCRRECRVRGIKSRIARREVESSQKLGRHRWVVERTFAWLNQFRRLTVRYERHADLHLALTTLACAVICLRQVRRFCP